MIISIVILVELILKFTAFLSELVGMPRNVASKIMWVPLAFELLRWYDSSGSISPWKIIGIEFLAATYQNNIIILFL